MNKFEGITFIKSVPREIVLNPLLPTGFGVKPKPFCPPLSAGTLNQPMSGTNLETSRVVLLGAVTSMLAAVLAVERDGVIGAKVDSCGSVVVLSYHDEHICI